MDIAMRFFLIGIFGVIIGMLGAFAMVEMIDKSNEYILRHPPDKEEEKKGDAEDEC